MNAILSGIEAADLAVAKAAAPLGETAIGGAICKVGKLGDQPPLRALALLTIGAGAFRQDRRLARAGLRMLAAHTLATGVKNLVKSRVDRTRPHLLIEEGQYEAKPGDSEDHDRTSFPSGHTAGVVAVAAAFARDYPQHRSAANAAAATIAAVQLPGEHHFLSDLAAGAAIGWLSEQLASALLPPAPN